MPDYREWFEKTLVFLEKAHGGTGRGRYWLAWVSTHNGLPGCSRDYDVPLAAGDRLTVEAIEALATVTRPHGFPVNVVLAWRRSPLTPL